MSEFNIDLLLTPRTTPSTPTTNTFGQPYEKNTSEEFGKALADQFNPAGGQAQNLLGDLTDVSLLENTTSAPDDRYESNFAQYGDIPFQQQVQGLIDEGVIDNNTFVISDTGHDIPIMATLTGNLDMDGTVNIPSFTDTDLSNGSRVISQAETWGNEISDNIDRNLSDGSVSSLFLGIEGHRNNADHPLNVSALPSADALKGQGIDKIVFLVEGPPSREYNQTGNTELNDYLHSMESAGIEVIFKGVDPRTHR